MKNERARHYGGAVSIDFRDYGRVEVQYEATSGDVESWYFSRLDLRSLELTERERDRIEEALWEDAQW